MAIAFRSIPRPRRAWPTIACTVWPARSLPGLHASGLSLYVPNVVLVFWSLPEGVDDAERLFAPRRQEEPHKRDVVYRQNGDRVDGTVTALDAEPAAWSRRRIAGFIRPGRSSPASPGVPIGKLALRTQEDLLSRRFDGGGRCNFVDLRLETSSPVGRQDAVRRRARIARSQRPRRRRTAGDGRLSLGVDARTLRASAVSGRPGRS